MSCLEPRGWPPPAARGGDLLPGESASWPVGPWTGFARTLKGVAPAHINEDWNFLGPQANELRDPVLLMQGCPAGDWNRLSWLISRNQVLPFSKYCKSQIGDRSTKSAFCRRCQQKSRFTSRPHCFYIVSKTNQKQEETCSPTHFYLEVCVKRDRNAVNETKHSLSWKVFVEKGCVNLWYAFTTPNFFFRNDWACAFLKWAAEYAQELSPWKLKWKLCLSHTGPQKSQCTFG